MGLTAFLLYGIACAVLLGATGIWRLTDAVRHPETDVFDVIYGMLAVLSSVLVIGSFVVNEPVVYLVSVLDMLVFLALVFVRVRIESDSFRDQYRKFIELGLTLVSFINPLIRLTETDDQWWISIVFLMFPIWALHSLITKADREQTEFQASSKQRDGEALDRTGQEPDADNG